jgi:hypothetical protein
LKAVVYSGTYLASGYRKTVKQCILEQFAGPPGTGIFSPSVQNTLYLAERMILDKVEQVRIDHSHRI